MIRFHATDYRVDADKNFEVTGSEFLCLESTGIRQIDYMNDDVYVEVEFLKKQIFLPAEKFRITVKVEKL